MIYIYVDVYLFFIYNCKIFRIMPPKAVVPVVTTPPPAVIV